MAGGRPPVEPDGEPRCPSDVPAAAAAEPLPAISRTSTPDAVRRGPSMPTAVAADPDLELVNRWLAGDEAAFESLVHRHHARLFRFLRRMLGDASEAEDVLQETFLNVHRHGRRFRGEARFSTFLFRAAANGALNRRRGLGRRAAWLERLRLRQATGHALPSTPRDPERAAQDAQTERLVQDALLRIPARLRLPLLLYDVEGLAYREIAAATHLREGTVKSRIHRARRLLREHLRPVLARGDSEDRS
jgi:RNA polymerase sigma-70 factor (ECF subfamily)